MLSAVVFRKSKDLEAVKTLRAVRELLGKPPKYALNLSQYGEMESRYFELLKPTVYRHDKTGALGYGLKFWPKSAELLQQECPHVAVFVR